MAPSKALYTRVDDDTKQYLDDLAKDSGLSIGRVAAVLLDGARRRGWRVSNGAPQVQEPD